MKRAQTGLLVILFLPMACSTKLDKEGYMRWVRNYENGLHVRKTYSDFVFDVQYAPSPYLSLMSGGQPVVSDSLQYYILRVSLADGGNFMRYNTGNATELQQRQYYFSYLFQNDLSLEEGDARKPCVLFHFEQSSLAKEKVFMIAFETDRVSVSNPRLVIDTPIFGSLPIKIGVSKKNIPSVKI